MDSTVLVFYRAQRLLIYGKPVCVDQKYDTNIVRLQYEPWTYFENHVRMFNYSFKRFVSFRTRIYYRSMKTVIDRTEIENPFNGIR